MGALQELALQKSLELLKNRE